MANLPNNPFAELRNLEARVDGRLEMLTRAEANLRSLLDALREQVSSAVPVIDQLNKLLPDAKAWTADTPTAPTTPTLGELSAALAVGVDQARLELDDHAARVRQQAVDELQAAIRSARTAAVAEAMPQPSRAELAGLVEAFHDEARATLDHVRETLADRLDLLSADTKLNTEPVLNGIDAARRQAEAAVRTAADLAQADMRLRADQLRGSIDEISVVLEQRLTQRTAALQQRAESTMNALKPAMDDRLAALLAALESTIQTRERELVARIEAYPQRLDRQLADAEAQLMDRLARTERHAGDMTQYLENKLTARVDELVGRLRLKLQKELNQVAAVPTPEPRVATPPACEVEAERPTLEASVFVQSVRRPNLSQAA